MNTKKIYIAGKVTGLPRPEALAKFYTYEEVLRNEGHEPVNPMALVDENIHSWEVAMRICIRALMDCHEAHFLPCYSQSPGAQLEYDICLRLGIPVLRL